MSSSIEYRKQQLGGLTNEIGVYVLADLDDVPLYVGQSTDGIRKRVQRHLTSARSDVIANRQLDVWEVAFVWSFPCDRADIDDLEADLYHRHHPETALMNGKVPSPSRNSAQAIHPTQKIQVISDEELEDRRSLELRLPRQANHYAELVSHFLTVKNSTEISLALEAHFQRLERFHDQMVSP